MKGRTKACCTTFVAVSGARRMLVVHVVLDEVEWLHAVSLIFA